MLFLTLKRGIDNGRAWHAGRTSGRTRPALLSKVPSHSQLLSSPSVLCPSRGDAMSRGSVPLQESGPRPGPVCALVSGGGSRGRELGAKVPRPRRGLESSGIGNNSNPPAPPMQYPGNFASTSCSSMLASLFFYAGVVEAYCRSSTHPAPYHTCRRSELPGCYQNDTHNKHCRSYVLKPKRAVTFRVSLPVGRF